jgi:hypothetical protein
MKDVLPLYVLLFCIAAGALVARAHVALSASTGTVTTGLPKRNKPAPKPQPTKTHTEESYGTDSQP